MKKPMPVLGTRLPRELVKRLDAYAAKHSGGGMQLTRSDAIRVLLTQALEADAAARTKAVAE